MGKRGRGKREGEKRKREKEGGLCEEGGKEGGLCEEGGTEDCHLDLYFCVTVCRRRCDACWPSSLAACSMVWGDRMPRGGGAAGGACWGRWPELRLEQVRGGGGAVEHREDRQRGRVTAGRRPPFISPFSPPPPPVFIQWEKQSN